MAILSKPIWTFLPGYFVSTNDAPDFGLETMVFPASEGARERETLFFVYVTGVDFGSPFDEYTRHYDTVAKAKAGHWEVVAEVKERICRDRT